MEKQTKAYSYALLSVLFWATVATAFKVTLDYLDYIQLLFYSSLCSAIILFVVVLVQGKLSQLKNISGKNLLMSTFLGFLNPFLYYLVLFKAYDLLLAQEAQPLNFTWPIMLALLSIPLLGQKITFRSIMALIISFSGVFVISTHGDVFGFSFTNPFGAGLAMGSGIIWALFWIYNMKDRRDELVKLFLNFFFGFLFSIPVLVFFSKPEIPEINGGAGAIYIGFFEMGITFVFWMRALDLSETTSQVSNLIYASPFLSLVFIHYIVGEEILISTIVGLVLIVGGIIIQNYSPGSPK